MPREGGTVPEQVVQHVANTADVDPLELPPLCESVDPDALAALVGGLSEGAVSFTYAGHDVTVESDGAIGLERRRSEIGVSEAR